MRWERLAEHAVTILAAVETARADLDPDAEPAGTVRVAGFATAVRRSLLPIAGELARTHPQVALGIHEHEPAEALTLLAADRVDLALTYDYNLAPATLDRAVEATPLWSTAWSLAIPHTAPTAVGNATAVFNRFRDSGWIVNSRGLADEQVVRTIGAMADYQPRIEHRANSLDLVHDLITAGLGIALLPADQPTPPGIHLLPLTDPDVTLRSYAVTRRGRAPWPPLALILDLLTVRTAL